MATTRRCRCILWLLTGASLCVLLHKSFVLVVHSYDEELSATVPAISRPTIRFIGQLSLEETKNGIDFEGKKYSSSVVVDVALPYYKSLLNRFLIGPYLDSKIPEHNMDAVIMAAGPDATLAASVHNLFHLCGFRRFIFVVNNATRDCTVVLDLVPQHNPFKPHLCFDHTAFYNEKEKQRIDSDYPALHRGAPGRLQRGGTKVQVPRMGWYLQQFSKFLVPRLVPDLSPQYLATDGDLVFTRPFSFVDTNATFVMPTTTKSPKNWWYFVDWIFGRDPKWQNDSDTELNFVVGWMVLDQAILNDLITDMNKNINDDNNDEFPFNILNQGEKIINQTFYSEFYVYARYAHHYSKKQIYRRQHIPEPARNPGNFQYTCVLTKNTYHNAQSNPKFAPFLIWEEHKHHSFQSCPDKKTTEQMTQLSTIGIWHDFHPPPWGGGNQFLLALRHGLQEWNNMTVLVKSHAENGQVPTTKSQAANSASQAQVLLANSITFKGDTSILEHLKVKNNLALVHRVDGPYFSTRYGRSLQDINTSSAMTRSIDIPEEDRKTKQINRHFACATVFQSKWSLEANSKIGLNLRNPVVIPNTVDPSIFYPLTPHVGLSPSRKVRIVATSHSSNNRKGFDTLLWVDTHLDWSRYEMMYMGGIPKVGFEPKHISILPPGDSQGVAEFLRSGDVYLAPSRDEPASNAVMEALACGLPVLYQEGSSHGDLVGRAGRGFSGPGPQLLKALDEIVEIYDDLVHAIRVPSMKDVSRQYLAIMRWCFYMKHLYFEK